MLLTVRANLSEIKMEGEKEGRGWQPKNPEREKIKFIRGKQQKKEEFVEKE